MAVSTAQDFDAFILDAWPLVRVRLQRPPKNDSEIQEFQNRFCGLLQFAAFGVDDKPPTPIALVMCLDGIVDATFEQKAFAAKFIHSVKPLVLAGALSATALVVSSEGAKAFLDFVLEVAPLTSKHAVFSSEEEGLAWLQK